MCYEANAVMLSVAQEFAYNRACSRAGRRVIKRGLVHRARPEGLESRVARVRAAQPTGEAKACLRAAPGKEVGKCSEAYYLERNSAMDDSIGGS